MEICLESGVDDYELRSEVDGCPLSPQQEGQVQMLFLLMSYSYDWTEFVMA